MAAPNESPIPLVITPAMWVAILVVAVTLQWGAPVDSDEHSNHHRPNAFASWDLTQIKPIGRSSARLDEIGLQISPAPGLDRYTLDFPNDRSGVAAIAMIDRRHAVVCRITALDPQLDPGSILSAGSELSATDLLTETVVYTNATVTWNCLRKCPAWPLRMHIGECDLGSQRVHVFVYEMHAESPLPDYHSGPIADFVASLAPL